MIPHEVNLEERTSSAHEVFRLAHLSDPHLISPSGVRVGELLNKRVYGLLSWHLHRHAEHRDEVLAALREDMQAAKPDHVVLTGDLTHLGLPGEFLEARALLRSLGPPSKVMVVPGNHDAYVATDWESTFHLWADYMASDADRDPPRAGTEDPRNFFPTVRVRGAIALIGVSTAYPTPPFLATGSIGKVQLEKLAGILDETRSRRLVRVVLIHHPPVPGAVRWRNRLTDQEVFHALLARHGAELILHGHTHRTCRGHLETPWGRVSVIGVPSASALGRTVHRRARYHLFRLIRSAGGFEMFLTVRVYSPTERRFIEEGEQRVVLPLPPG
jgi:3',5'-cyclic AMP phosphodiesterase CpdA